MERPGYSGQVLVPEGLSTESLALAVTNHKVDCQDESTQITEARIVSADRLVGLHPTESQSSGQTRSALILHLPAEILAQTFSLFQHPGIQMGKLEIHRASIDFTSSQHIIQNIRLVCRVFNILASRFLLPVLHIQNNKRSLHRIQALIKAPILQSGLHAIQVHFEFFFFELAGTRWKFFMHARDKAWHLTHCVTSSLNEEHDSDPSSVAKHKVMLDNLLALNSAAHHLLGGEPDAIFAGYTSNDKRLVSEYEGMLERAYTEYRSKYMEHREMIVGRSIVQELEHLFRGLKHTQPISLGFMQSPGRSFSSGVLDGTEGVYNSLTTAHAWGDIGRSRFELAGKEFALQAEMMWDIPIIIHQTGGTLISLGLCDTLVSRDYSLICSKKVTLPFTGPSDWLALSKACESLESVRLERLAYNFKLGDHSLPLVAAHSGLAEGLAFPISEYLGVLLSGRHLRSVMVNTAIEELDLYVGDRDRCPLGPVLARLDCQGVTILSLSNISISQEHLEALCRNMSQMLESVNLVDIALTDGNWGTSIDLLRERLMWRCTKAYCTIYINGLVGGDISLWMMRIKEPSGINDANMTERARERAANKEIMDILTGYINGSGASSNPIPILLT